MDFKLNEEHSSFVQAVRRYAHAELAPGALARAHSLTYPLDVAKSLARQGLLGIAFDERDGGQGGSLESI